MKSDGELVADHLNGDEKAFESIVNRYTMPLYNFIAHLNGSAEEADELTQEIFLKTWKNLKKFDTERNFKTWIFSIARNTAIDRMRKRKPLLFSQMETYENIPYEETIPDTEPLSDEIFRQAEMKKDIERALNELPADHRGIIVMHLTEKMTFEQIAEIVKKPMGTVKTQYRRALFKLRTLLNQK